MAALSVHKPLNSCTESRRHQLYNSNRSTDTKPPWSSLSKKQSHVHWMYFPLAMSSFSLNFSSATTTSITHFHFALLEFRQHSECIAVYSKTNRWIGQTFLTTIKQRLTTINANDSGPDPLKLLFHLQKSIPPLPTQETWDDTYRKSWWQL